ncbi:hypothetical protein VPH35_054577 [Triticum aestivum]
MAFGDSGGSDNSGGSWSTSLSTPETDELIRLGLMVSRGCRLPNAFRMTADGYPTRGPGASPDELRRHKGGRWNIVGRTKFWKWKDYWRVIAQARRESRAGGSSSASGGSSSAPRRPRHPPPAATPSPSSSRCPVPTLAGPASPPAVEIPPEQFAMREDGDPDDCPGYLIALRASQEEAAAAAAAAEAREAVELQAVLDAAAAMVVAAEAAELQAALDAAAGIGALQAHVAPVEDDAGDWDDGGKSSDNDDGDESDGGAGEIMDLPDRVREWPRRNLALLQYLYWEKVEPSTGPQYDPLALLSPLMRNWKEEAAEKRDKYAFEYSRGVGMRVIEKLNKSAIFYKAGDIEKEEENEYGDNSETRNYGGEPRKEWVYHPDVDNFKTPAKKNVQEDDEDDLNDSEEKRPYYCTPEYWDSFKGDKEDPIEVPEVCNEKSITSLGTDEIASRGSVGSIREDEVPEEVVGKRKCKVSNLMKSPYVQAIPTKRAKRSAKAKLFEKEVFQDEYDVIKASVKFVRAYEQSTKHRKKEIFNDGMHEGLSTERACKIFDHQWLTGDRKQLGYDIRDANASGAVNYPDVSTWPIKTYKMSQQEDG